MSLTVAVAGGGIGGLAAARALQMQGFDVRVYEQAPALGEVGAAVQMSPNAVRVLAALGAWEALGETACRPEATILRHYRTGETIASRPLGAQAEARYGFPYAQVLRADLHRALAQTLSGAAMQLNRRVTGFTAHAQGVSLRFDGGGSADADVLVGADGVRSAVREALFGPEAATFRNEVAFRGLAPVTATGPVPPAGVVWLGPEKHFVSYPVAGGTKVNCIGIVRADTWTEEGWSARATQAEWHAAFEGWREDVHALIAAVEQPFKWALYDRDPLPRWSQGRATLLGDAAHAMLPSMSQGAAQAIEDGWVLAACLMQSVADPAAGLLRYEALRRERTARVQLQSRENQRLSLLPIDAPPEEMRAALIREAVSREDLFDWLYGYDAIAAASAPKALDAAPAPSFS